MPNGLLRNFGVLTHVFVIFLTSIVYGLLGLLLLSLAIAVALVGLGSLGLYNEVTTTSDEPANFDWSFKFLLTSDLVSCLNPLC